MQARLAAFAGTQRTLTERTAPERIFVTIASAGETLASTEQRVTIFPHDAATEAVAGPAAGSPPFREARPTKART